MMVSGVWCIEGERWEWHSSTMALASSARRLCSRIGFSSLRQTSSVSSSSPSVDAERLLSSLSLGNGNVGLFGRVFSTGVSNDLAEQAKEGLILSKPPPRPFKLNNEQRELAEEIGYKVIDRYTEEDFGRNKRPKAFAVVQVWFDSCSSRNFAITYIRSTRSMT